MATHPKTRWTVVLGALALGACSMWGGGGTEPRAPGGSLFPRVRSLHAPRVVDPKDGESRTVVVGYSVEGRPIRCTFLGRGEALVLVLAAIHGDEAAGAPLVRRLQRTLEDNPDLLQNRRVALIAVANPDGLVHGLRLNVRGIDINRNFPAYNWREGTRRGPRALSEPETRALHKVIRDHQPVRIISIHQPLRLIDYDGPARGVAKAMGRRTNLSVRKMRKRRGSLGAFAGRTLGIPTVTLELPDRASELDISQLWARYGDALLASIRWPRPLQDGGARSHARSEP